MKKIVFATSNPTKAKRFSKGLLENGIEIMSLKDIDIETMSKAVGRKCGIISVNDKSFAEAIKGGYANDQ